MARAGKIGRTSQTAAEAFELSIKFVDPGQRVAAVRSKAAEITKNNCWARDNKLSNINNRHVYKDRKGSFALLIRRKGDSNIPTGGDTTKVSSISTVIKW